MLPYVSSSPVEYLAGAPHPHQVFQVYLWFQPSSGCDVWSICSLPERKFDTDSPHTSKTHQSSQSKVSQTFYLSLRGTLRWLIVRWSSPSVPNPLPLSYPCINLHSMWKIANDNVLKNGSQYLLAIQINNFLLPKGGNKIEQTATERKMCQHCFLYWHLRLRGCEEMCVRVLEGTCVCVSWEQKMLWIFDACRRLQWPL